MATHKTTKHRAPSGQRLVTKTTTYPNGKGNSVTRTAPGLFSGGKIVSTKKW